MSKDKKSDVKSVYYDIEHNLEVLMTCVVSGKDTQIIRQYNKLFLAVEELRELVTT